MSPLYLKRISNNSVSSQSNSRANTNPFSLNLTPTSIDSNKLILLRENKMTQKKLSWMRNRNPKNKKNLMNNKLRKNSKFRKNNQSLKIVLTVLYLILLKKKKKTQVMTKKKTMLMKKKKTMVMTKMKAMVMTKMKRMVMTMKKTLVMTKKKTLVITKKNPIKFHLPSYPLKKQDLFLSMPQKTQLLRTIPGQNKCSLLNPPTTTSSPRSTTT